MKSTLFRPRIKPLIMKMAFFFVIWPKRHYFRAENGVILDLINLVSCHILTENLLVVLCRLGEV